MGSVGANNVSPVVSQGVNIFTYLMNSIQATIVWQPNLPPQASYTNIKGGKATHLILPYPFEPKRQLVCLHEWGHWRRYHAMLPSQLEPETLQKPKVAYKNKSQYEELVKEELAAWQLVASLIIVKQYKFDPKDLVDPVITWGLNRYYTNYCRPNAALREDTVARISYLDKAVPGFKELPAIQKFLSELEA